MVDRYIRFSLIDILYLPHVTGLVDISNVNGLPNAYMDSLILLINYNLSFFNFTYSIYVCIPMNVPRASVAGLLSIISPGIEPHFDCIISRPGY